MAKYRNYVIFILFLAMAILLLSGVIFSDKLLGRSIDFTIPPVDYLVKNVYVQDFYTWNSITNAGSRNTFPPTLIPVNTILYLPLIFGAGSWFIGRYQLVITIFLSLAFFYILAGAILKNQDISEKQKPWLSILGAVFFTLNGYLFNELIYGSNVMFATFAFIPLLLYAIISYQTTRKLGYFFLSLCSLLIVSSTLQHMVLAYALFVILSFVFKDIKLLIKVGTLHLLLSLYWILPMFLVSKEIASSELSGNCISSLINTPSSFLSALVNRDYVLARNTYNMALGSRTLSGLWVVNAYILLFFALNCLFRFDFFKNTYRRLIIAFSLVLIVSLIFIKGANEPFGGFVVFAYKIFPLLNLFRSIQHFISFYVIAISVLFVLSGVTLVKRWPKMLPILTVLIVINAMPWWYTRDLGTQTIVNSKKNPAYLGLYKLTPGNEKLYSLQKEPGDFAILTIPPGFSIEFLPNESMPYKTQGGDGGLSYGNKRYYCSECKSVLTPTLNQLEKSLYTDNNALDKNANLLGLLNVEYVILREDVRPVFSRYADLFDPDAIKSAIAKSTQMAVYDKADYVTILRNKKYIPHIYVPHNIIISNEQALYFSNIVSRPNFPPKAAVYFEEQNKGKMNEMVAISRDSVPKIEFKRVSPVKYRVIVHNAKNKFPLVFSETYHRSWRLYGSSTEHAVSNGADGENFSLPQGSVYETWFKRPVVSENNHLVANSYANSWIIDPAELCRSSSYCQKVGDGYEMNLVIEFWPQRLFYLGLLIGAFLLLAMSIFQGYAIFRKQRR